MNRKSRKQGNKEKQQRGKGNTAIVSSQQKFGRKSHN